MVGENIANRVKAIPKNATAAFNDFTSRGIVPAVIQSGTRFGEENRKLFRGVSGGKLLR